VEFAINVADDDSQHRFQIRDVLVEETAFIMAPIASQPMRSLGHIFDPVRFNVLLDALRKEELFDLLFLAKCIQQYIKADRIKDMAERAHWLGSDWSHYERRFLNKDITDLKTMLRIVISDIDSELN